MVPPETEDIAVSQCRGGVRTVRIARTGRLRAIPTKQAGTCSGACWTRPRSCRGGPMCPPCLPAANAASVGRQAVRRLSLSSHRSQAWTAPRKTGVASGQDPDRRGKQPGGHTSPPLPAVASGLIWRAANGRSPPVAGFVDLCAHRTPWPPSPLASERLSGSARANRGPTLGRAPGRRGHAANRSDERASRDLNGETKRRRFRPMRPGPIARRSHRQ